MKKKTNAKCYVFNCNRTARDHGLCHAHFQRLLAHGTVQAFTPIKQRGQKGDDAQQEAR